MKEESKSNALRIGAGALTAIAVGVAFSLFTPPPDPEPTALGSGGSATTSTADVEPVAEADPAEDAATISEMAETPAPLFDTFRVEADGTMVVAGQGEPGQIIDIILAGEAIDRVTADASGSFVAFPVAGPSDEPRKLTLLADPDGAAIGSDTSFIVAPIAAPQALAAADLDTDAPELTEPSETGAGGAAALSSDTSDVTEDVALLPQTALVAPSAETALPTVDVATVTPPVAAVAPTVLQADAEGVRVVQASPSAVALRAVALDAITYDPSGEVQLSGRALGDGEVQIYLDNQPLITSPISDDGQFQVDLPDVDTGVYTLRIDELDNDGDVVSRIETPFKREEAEDVAAVLAEQTSEDGFEVAVKTVQPGSTLWAIAEESLGNGIFYVEVFEANADLIRDPDLIYPGQIFRIPEVTE